jgi:hypothetical protein
VLKITDPDYFLPIIHALEAGPVLSSGHGRPMLTRGVCIQTGKRAKYVAKLNGSEHLSDASHLNEILCAYLAREMDYLVPEPVVIHVSPEFVDIMKNHENFIIAQKSVGYNFGNYCHLGFQE